MPSDMFEAGGLHRSPYGLGIMLASSYRPLLGSVGNIIRDMEVFWAFSPALTACCQRFSHACFQFRATVMRRKISMRTSHKGIVGTRSQPSFICKVIMYEEAFLWLQSKKMAGVELPCRDST